MGLSCSVVFSSAFAACLYNGEDGPLNSVLLFFSSCTGVGSLYLCCRYGCRGQRGRDHDRNFAYACALNIILCIIITITASTGQKARPAYLLFTPSIESIRWVLERVVPDNEEQSESSWKCIRFLVTFNRWIRSLSPNIREVTEEEEYDDDGVRIEPAHQERYLCWLPVFLLLVMAMIIMILILIDNPTLRLPGVIPNGTRTDVQIHYRVDNNTWSESNWNQCSKPFIFPDIGLKVHSHGQVVGNANFSFSDMDIEYRLICSYLIRHKLRLTFPNISAMGSITTTTTTIATPTPTTNNNESTMKLILGIGDDSVVISNESASDYALLIQMLVLIYGFIVCLGIGTLCSRESVVRRFDALLRPIGYFWNIAGLDIILIGVLLSQIIFDIDSPLSIILSIVIIMIASYSLFPYLKNSHHSMFRSFPLVFCLPYFYQDIAFVPPKFIAILWFIPVLLRLASLFIFITFLSVVEYLSLGIWVLGMVIYILSSVSCLYYNGSTLQQLKSTECIISNAYDVVILWENVRIAKLRDACTNGQRMTIIFKECGGIRLHGNFRMRFEISNILYVSEKHENDVELTLVWDDFDHLWRFDSAYQIDVITLEYVKTMDMELNSISDSDDRVAFLVDRYFGRDDSSMELREI